MQIHSGQTAFITGGASGIGLGIALACARKGLKVVIADIEANTLEAAKEELEREGIAAHTIRLDVADRQAVDDAASEAYDIFGEVHLICNNAGIVVCEPLGEIVEHDWDWIVDVNLRGVIHGVESFASRMISKGTAGHIVNTGSIGSLIALPGFSPYSATKFAVAGMTEGWRAQLAPHNIGVSLLCPGSIRTNLFDSRRNRQPKYGDDSAASCGSEVNRATLSEGMAPDILGEYILDCVNSNQPYILSHNEYRPLVEKVYEDLLAACEMTRKSKSMGGLPEAPVPSFF